MTNVSASAYADMPLFLFHLLEHMEVEYEIDVDEINRRWSSHDATDVWSQLILKEPNDSVELLTEVPKTGIWRLDGASITFSRWGNDWHSLLDETEGFYLRVLAPNDYRYKGADLGILVTRGACRRRTTSSPIVADSGSAIRSQFGGTPVDQGRTRRHTTRWRSSSPEPLSKWSSARRA